MELGKRDNLLVATERAVLLGILSDTYEMENPLNELANLTETAGATVVGKVTQKRQKPEPGKYVGKGKLDELKRVCDELKANVVICEDDLTPSQVSHIEEIVQMKVIDRTELILDIFAIRASTHQAQLQVELAQMEYSLPRLKRMWKHLERIEGGIGTRGPGEKQIESDRRQIKKKISDLRDQLRKIEEHKEREVIHRNENHYTVALVGYTNAGKSTLMNQLTHADALVENRLFSTIATKTKEMKMGNLSFLVSDTVGFIRKLPHRLVASFQATLEEAKQSQLLLHVVDASHPECQAQIQAVEKVLADLKMQENPILLVFNKMDQVQDYSLLGLEKFSSFVEISAKTGKGIDILKQKIVEHFAKNRESLEFLLPPQSSKLLSYIYDKGDVSISSAQTEGTLFRVCFDKRDSAWFKNLLQQSSIPFQIVSVV